MEKTKLCPPIANYYLQMAALFQEDPDVAVVYRAEENIIELLVDGSAKAEALEILLANEKTFGNEFVNIVVKPRNQKPSIADLYRDAFFKNPAVVGIYENHGLLNSTHVLFKPKVVQYRNGDTGDPNGIHSTLYQNLADNVFYKHDGVFFNTVPIIDYDADDEDGSYDE